MPMVMQVISGLIPSEAARTLGITPARVRQMLTTGQLRYVATPLGRVVDADDVERLRQEREARQARKAGS
jgi:predicted site-specific integrase-resolvase